MALPEAFKKNILKMKAKAEKAKGESDDASDDASVSGASGDASSSGASEDEEASSDAPDMKGKPNPLKAWAAKQAKK